MRHQECLVRRVGHPPRHDSREPAAALRNALAASKKCWEQQQLLGG